MMRLVLPVGSTGEAGWTKSKLSSVSFVIPREPRLRFASPRFWMVNVSSNVCPTTAER